MCNSMKLFSELSAGIALILMLTFFNYNSIYAVDTNFTNAKIKNAIEQELLLNSQVLSQQVDVVVNEGIVSLSGTVNHLLAKDKAAEIAKSIKGVRSVVNNVSVQPIERTDEALHSDIVEALFDDPATDSYEVRVTVDDGTVVLTGNVDSWQEKQLCEEVVKGVIGVKEVKNDISFELNEERADAEILNEINRRLESSVWVDDEFININVEDGKVILSGTVGSAEEKATVYTKAWVAGVNTVDIENLKTRNWAEEPMKREDKYAIKSDAELKKAVEDALIYDPRVLSFNPKVEVDNGVVTLSGFVGNLKAKRAAEEDAMNTFGVWRVKNFLKVLPEDKLEDKEITQNIKDAIERDPYLNKNDLSVSVYDGYVYLNGMVESEFKREHAEEVASRVKGVLDVSNHVKVDELDIVKSDWEIEQDIQDGLFWEPFVDSDDIKVDVENGVATLEGTVDSWKEYRMAASEAFQNGALSVKNHLNVRYGPDDLRPQTGQK